MMCGKAKLLCNFSGYHNITKSLFFNQFPLFTDLFTLMVIPGLYSIKVAAQIMSRGWVHPELQALSR
jgi:hypothetical protein